MVFGNTVTDAALHEVARDLAVEVAAQDAAPQPPDILTLTSGVWPCLSHRIVGMTNGGRALVQEVYAHGEYLWLATYPVESNAKLVDVARAEVVRCRAVPGSARATFEVAD